MQETSPLLSSSRTLPHAKTSSNPSISCELNTTPSISNEKGYFSSLNALSTSRISLTALLGGALLIGGFILNSSRSAPLPSEGMPMKQDVQTLSIFSNKFTGSFEIIRGRRDPDAVAIGTYQLNVEDAGWNYLEVEATPQDDSMDQYLKSMRAMGYVEGFLTWRQIEQYYSNYYQGNLTFVLFKPSVGMFDTLNPYPVDPDIRVQQYLLDNFHWMSEKSKAKYTESAHWLTVRGIVEQLEGLVDGFVDGRQEYRSINGYRADDDLLDDQPTNSFDNPSNLNGNSEDNTHLTTLKHPYILHFMLLNSNGDLYQVVEKLNALDEAVKSAMNADSINISSDESRKLGPEIQTISGASLTKSRHAGDHCSAFIKMLPDESDVVFAHNTWDDYRNMGPRIFKHYIFPPWPMELKKEERQKDTYVGYKHSPYHKHHRADDSNEEDHCLCPANQFSKPIPRTSSDSESPSTRYHFPPHSYFSSSPGVLTSVDDFYTTYTSPNLHIEENKNKNCYCEGPGGRLGIMETSLDVKKPELYELIRPESLLSWVRVRSANLLAIDGKDWISKFSYDHSGTYANQWMVIDFTKFQEKSEVTRKGHIQPGFLTVVEEMPGLIKTGDETDTLLVVILLFLP